MIRFRLLLLVSLCVLVSCFSLPVMAEENGEIRFVIGQNSYYTNGVEKSIDVAPCIRDGRTYLPLRAAANAVGITDSDISWNSNTQTVSLKKGDKALCFVVGSTEMRINQSTVIMDVPAEMIDGRVMLPIKWLAQALDCDTSWDPGTQTVRIKAQQMEGLSLPGDDWGIVFDIKDFTVKDRQIRKDQRGRMLFAENTSNGVLVTVSMEEEKETADSKKVRDYYWNNLQADTRVKRENVAMEESGDMAILEYDINVPGTTQTVQSNYWAFMAHGKVYIYIHLSKVSSGPINKGPFETFLSKVKIVEPTVEEIFGVGCSYYLKKDYQNASMMYEKALEMEKKERKLTRDEWRVLVDNLAMAYGIPGNLAKCKETLEYGISQDPTYPNFYYSLACAYAEGGDMQKTLANLELAFKYQENMIAGEKFPDPRTDSSFAKFMQKEEFSQALDKIINK